MKVKVAILDVDQTYLNRVVSALNLKYTDKIELYSFTNLEIALDSLDSARIDVFIASDSFDIDVKALPNRCAFAYFIDAQNVDSVKDQVAICKFQKADQIYKQILSVFAEKAGDLSGLKSDDGASKILVFESVSGGTGASTVAAATAIRFAKHGYRTLYLNLEKLGSADAFFSGPGQNSMGDIIFALKSRKSNLLIKLESCVKQDESGVFFFSQTGVALDMLELSSGEIIQLLDELKYSGSYDYIILDIDFSLDASALDICRQAMSVVWVGDGSEISNIKLFRAYTALNIIEESKDYPITNKIKLIYNKFSNKTGKVLDDIRSLDGIPRFEHASTKEAVTALSDRASLDELL